MCITDDSDLQEFREWLLQIGHGLNSDEDGKIKIPQDIRSNNIDSLMNFIYPNLNSPLPPPPEYFLNHIILAPRNSDVNAVNEALLNKMNGDIKIFYSADEIIHESCTDDHGHLSLTPS